MGGCPRSGVFALRYDVIYLTELFKNGHLGHTFMHCDCIKNPYK